MWLLTSSASCLSSAKEERGPVSLRHPPGQCPCMDTVQQEAWVGAQEGNSCVLPATQVGRWDSLCSPSTVLKPHTCPLALRPR